MIKSFLLIYLIFWWEFVTSAISYLNHIFDFALGDNAIWLMRWKLIFMMLFTVYT